jgi:hypothetical protein
MFVRNKFLTNMFVIEAGLRSTRPVPADLRGRRPERAEKIRAKHHLDPADIVAAVQAPPRHLGRRDQDGEKVYMIVRIGQTSVLVVLYPAGEDVWRLASADVISGGQGA